MQQMEWREALDEARAAKRTLARAGDARRGSRGEKLERQIEAQPRRRDAISRGAADLVRKLMFLERFARGHRRRLRARWDESLMALLQISEPGQSPEPHQQRLAVGIDLGTTNSLVATVRSGIAEVLPDAQGRPLLPSVVRYLPGGGVEVGYAAQARRRRDDPHNTHRLGEALHGPRPDGRRARARTLPYDFVDAPGMVQIAHASRA